MIVAGCKEDWHGMCKKDGASGQKDLLSATLSGKIVNVTNGESINYEPMMHGAKNREEGRLLSAKTTRPT